jgi:hypothetical protein
MQVLIELEKHGSQGSQPKPATKAAGVGHRDAEQNTNQVPTSR